METTKIVMMSGLRIYTRSAAVDVQGVQAVFYSRRGDGPYYRWRYEEAHGQWIGSRMPAFDSGLKELSVARWKAVPIALQARLIDHYIE